MRRKINIITVTIAAIMGGIVPSAALAQSEPLVTVTILPKPNYDELIKRANSGDANAQMEVGDDYYFGQRISEAPDYQKAMEYYLMAANQNNVIAQHYVCWWYYRGTGITPDDIQGGKWCYIAVMNGDEDSLDIFNVIKANTTPAKIAEAQKLGDEWLAAHKKYPIINDK